MRRISRRNFLATSTVALGALPLIRATELCAQPVDPVFRHGVASGDPLADRVILWTRVTPKSPGGAETVSWQIARDPKMAQVVSRGAYRSAGPQPIPCHQPFDTFKHARCVCRDLAGPTP